MDATLSFPARIKQDFQRRTGFPVGEHRRPAGRSRPERRARGATGAKRIASTANQGCRHGRCASSTPRSASSQTHAGRLILDYRDVAGVKVPRSSE